MIDDAEHIDRLRAICLVLPEATEVETFGCPTFRVATTPFAVFERDEGVPVVRVKADLDRQAELVQLDGFEVAPETGSHGWTNIRLDLGVPWEEIDPLVVASYRLQAPKHLRAALTELLVAAGEDAEPEVEEPVDLERHPTAAERRAVVVIEVASDDADAVRAAEEAWRAATEGRRASSRVLHAAGGDRQLLVIEYTSAADAEHDAALGETAQLLDRLAELSGGERPPVATLEVRWADRR